MERLIRVDPNGVAYSLHADDHPLLKLGPVQVERASNVQFREDDQKWYVHVVLFPKKQEELVLAKSFINRKDAIKHEIHFLEGLMQVDNTYTKDFFTNT